MKINQIVFATDFSNRDQAAFRQSCRLALDWNSKLNIVFIDDPREQSKKLDPNREFLRYLPSDLAIDFDQITLTGDAAEEIVAFADEVDAALIVLGTHGRTGLDRVFNGSIAETVLRKSRCPVMTIKDADKALEARKLNKVLVPVDFSVYGYAAVDFASRLATTTNANLTICHVDESDTPNQRFPHDRPEWSQHETSVWDQLKKFVPTCPSISFKHKLLKGRPGAEIIEYANSKKYDYIVIGTHGRSGVSRTIMGSVAEYVLRHSDCPVITVKPSDKRSKLVAG